MAHCRSGELGYNLAVCQNCQQKQWYASSCGDRHCPNCLRPRQAKWSEKTCDRLPDCPHFHVVFTVPRELHEFFRLNYREAANLLFGAASETLQQFQKNNWQMKGGYFGVLHTWGSSLNWHPHLHLLVASGGQDISTGCWRQARKNYLFAVKAMSKVFGAILLRELEALESESSIHWPEQVATVESRRDWRLLLATKNWNIFSRPTLKNTRAVVRYLARYTSQIAMSNHRIEEVDDENRTVSFKWKDYRDGGQSKLMKLSGYEFMKRFTRHLVPKGFRRVRYYGFLSGSAEKVRQIPGSPSKNIGEKAVKEPAKGCENCDGTEWNYVTFYQHLAGIRDGLLRVGNEGTESFSLVNRRRAP